jgi:hypothetical protein
MVKCTVGILQSYSMVPDSPLAEEDEAVADEDYLEGAGIMTITSSVKVSQTHGTYHV